MRKWRFGWLPPDLHCIPRGNSRLNQLRNVGPLGYLNPRVEGHQSILASASCRGLGIGFVAAWSFRFRGGFVLSYRWFASGVGLGRSDLRRFRVNNVGPRSVLVLDVSLGGGFVSIVFAPGV